MYWWVYCRANKKYWGGKDMVEKTIDRRIMESIQRYIEKISIS